MNASWPFEIEPWYPSYTREDCFTYYRQNLYSTEMETEKRGKVETEA